VFHRCSFDDLIYAVGVGRLAACLFQLTCSTYYSMRECQFFDVNGPAMKERGKPAVGDAAGAIGHHCGRPENTDRNTMRTAAPKLGRIMGAPVGTHGRKVFAAMTTRLQASTSGIAFAGIINMGISRCAKSVPQRCLGRTAAPAVRAHHDEVGLEIDCGMQNAVCDIDISDYRIGFHDPGDRAHVVALHVRESLTNNSFTLVHKPIANETWIVAGSVISHEWYVGNV
jgi:hypothetical protein